VDFPVFGKSNAAEPDAAANHNQCPTQSKNTKESSTHTAYKRKSFVTELSKFPKFAIDNEYFVVALGISFPASIFLNSLYNFNYVSNHSKIWVISSI